jgi:hypothetical protein
MIPIIHAPMLIIGEYFVDVAGMCTNTNMSVGVVLGD